MSYTSPSLSLSNTTLIPKLHKTMKKLYRKGQVHPSPSSDQLFLSYLPAAIFTLTLALSSQDKEALAYLLSSSFKTPFDFDTSNKTHFKKNNQAHPPSFSCYCFTCYTYYWALWDSSPNRHLIHEIIDAFEDNLVSQNKFKKKHGLSRREKRKNNNKKIVGVHQSDCSGFNDDGDSESIRVNPELGRVDSVDGKVCDETREKQGSRVRKIVSFIGDKLWGSVWG